jgi:acyl-CoA synthetase (AMP-forming)/AMP-acid ligase II
MSNEKNAHLDTKSHQSGIPGQSKAMLLPYANKSESLVDLILRRGSESPERVGWTYLTFYSSDAFREDRLTYGDLLERAKAVAATLLLKCARGDRVLILCPPGFDYICAFFGCQLAGIVAVPAYPPRNAKHMQRLKTIVEDAGATAILAPFELRDRSN